ncbi:WD40-repeat-containing domain protein [Mycena polygramma]|nr:WD40-repeat-containing domain protein [Mycena polygramma]KAJ7652873.1 WD40-repeat-containing domain protein [Mycena polygramma]
MSVRFSPDGTQIASGSLDRTVRVCHAQTGALVAEPFTGHTDWVHTVHFSADGTQIVSGSRDHTVRICKVRDLEQQTHLTAPINSSPNKFDSNLVFDADSGWIRNIDGSLMLWIPPWLREGLYLPHNTLVIAARGTTKLDLSHFVHGTEWTKCFDPKTDTK